MDRKEFAVDWKTLTGAAIFVSCIVSGNFLNAQIELPKLDAIEGLGDTPEFTMEELIPVSKKPVNMTIPVEKGHDSAGLTFTLNFPAEFRVGIETEDGTRRVFTFVPVAQKMARRRSAAEAFGRVKIEITEPEPVFQNQALNIRGLDITYYVRPKFDRYNAKVLNKSMIQWEELPDALSKSVRFDARPAVDGIAITVDGRYAGTVKGSNKLALLYVQGGAGPTIDNAKSYKNTFSTPFFEAIDFGCVANPGIMKEAKSSLGAGYREIEGIPMILSDGPKSSDLSLTRATRGLELLEVDYNLSRDAFERLPEAQITAVPLGFYSYAYLLFALDPDPKKERAMTIRMTRFCDGDGRGSALAHTDVKLPADDSQFPANIKKVGTVQLNGAEVPLYFGKFPINTGELLDIIDNDPHPRGRNRKNPYLDFELFGSRGGIGTYTTGHMKPSGRPSAFNIFGVTLERAPAELHLKQNQPGNIFNNDDVPQTTALIKAKRPGTYLLEWTIGTIEGKEFYPDRLDWKAETPGIVLKKESRELTLAAEETCEVTIPLSMPELGHYTLEFNLHEKGKPENNMNHKAFFALLGKDDRQATPAESPFGSWWTSAHHGTPDPHIALKVFNKAGIRRIPPGAGMPNSLKKDVFKQYKITINQIGWAGNFPPDDLEKAYEYFEEKIDPQVEKFPDCNAANIFHESYGDPLPPEILGEKGAVGNGRDLNFVQRATVIAEYYRKKFPHIKLMYGNNTSSAGLIAALLRNHFDVSLIDYIGLETPAQGCVPERLWQGGTQGAWFARETGRLIAGKDFKLSSCYESSARPRRILGYQRQAEYLIRDALVGLAYGFEHLGISGLSDPGNGYNQTLWGDGGLCERNPLLYPKPIYVAYATLTKALDQAKFQRKMDTGSNVVYSHEYARKRGDFAYANWTPKQEVELLFTFPEDTEAELLSFYGKIEKRKTKNKKLTLRASEAPVYLLSPVKALSVKAEKRFNPEVPKAFTVADKLDDLSKWRLIPKSNSLPNWDIFRRTGKFEVREVKDEEKGRCIEFKLIKEGEKPDIFAEYTKIEMKQPVTLPGKPDRIGVWVKGDGGWGKIGFEIQDANGWLWRSEGMWHDFPGNLYINFDGWRFVDFPITGEGKPYPINQSLGGYWGGNGGRSIAYPVKVNGLYITLNRKALDPTDMKDVDGVIRISSIGSIELPTDEK